MMGIIYKTLEKYAPEYEIIITPDMLEQFEIYACVMLEFNKKINLTAITQPEEIAVKHFLDSLMLLNATEIERGKSLIDIGSGAGFPGIPLKIARPDLNLILLESLNKRVKFLAEMSEKLGQDNTLIHGRAENCAHDTQYRECFDYATARAVAALPVLCEYCLPFVKTGGTFAAFKGPGAERETENIGSAVEALGARVIGIKKIKLPLDIRRTIIIIKKISQTPSKYPRSSSKITKSPLK